MNRNPRRNTMGKRKFKNKKGKKVKKYQRQRKAKVHCSNCPAFVNQDETKFINIEEDTQGVDVLTFECPYCNTEQKSRIFM
jgi:hypothetical protein